MLLLGMTAIMVFSFVFELRAAESAIQKYVGIWEDEIAKARLLNGDPTLQLKILNQLKDLHPAVVLPSGAGEACVFGSSVPLSYNALPVSHLDVCLSPGALIYQALLSPLIFLGFIFGFAFIVLFSHKEYLNQMKQQKLQSDLDMNRELAQLSRQVAHDIRGPLMALTTLSQLSHEMTIDKKELLNLSVSRIQGIANDLLTRGQSPSQVVQNSTSTGHEILPLVQSLLKEYEFSNPQIEFALHNHIYSEEFNLNFEPLKLQRIISNLMTNAIEACQLQTGQVHLTLMERDAHWLIQILDNGVGIPEEVIPKLGYEGCSFGKDHGTGLGLYDAKRYLESCGGELQIRSRWGEGTQVLLIFPKSSPSRREA